jgi:hypothetical protein
LALMAEDQPPAARGQSQAKQSLSSTKFLFLQTIAIPQKSLYNLSRKTADRVAGVLAPETDEFALFQPSDRDERLRAEVIAPARHPI